MTTPDQLEREIAEAMWEIRAKRVTLPAIPDYAEIAAKICRQKMREVAEKAFDSGYKRCCWEEGIFKYKNNYPSKQEWLKENNLLNDNDQG